MAEVKKENWFKRTWGKVKKYFRELRSELKKVVWQSACSSGCSTSLPRSALTP